MLKKPDSQTLGATLISQCHAALRSGHSIEQVIATVNQIAVMLEAAAPTVQAVLEGKRGST